MVNEFDADSYPSIDAAFAFVVPRYQMSVQRFDAALTRATQVGTFVPAAFFPALAFVAAAAKHPDYSSPWFIGAAVLAVLSTLSAWAARFVCSAILMPDLTKMHGEMLHFTEARFKADSIAVAGLAADANSRVVDRIYTMTLIAMVLFGCCVAALSVWAAQQL